VSVLRCARERECRAVSRSRSYPGRGEDAVDEGTEAHASGDEPLLDDGQVLVVVRLTEIRHARLCDATHGRVRRRQRAGGREQQQQQLSVPVGSKLYTSVLTYWKDSLAHLAGSVMAAY
jgi:hypothetical protein